MTHLWTSDEIAKALQFTATQEVSWRCDGISIDTRTLNPGDLFIAITGEKGDGHDYILQAAEKGAAGAIVCKDKAENLNTSLPCFIVADTLEALRKLAVAARQRSSAKRLAITGNVGKTGTKEMLRLVLSNQGKTHANVSSYNNYLGVPITLARMPQDTEYAVFEVGMNHPGEITPLTQMIAPHIAIITQVVEAHAGFFKSVEEIARAKAEIFEGLSPDGIAILNQDNPHFELLSQLAYSKKAKQVIGFGTNTSAAVRLLDVNAEVTGSQIKADILGQEISYLMPIPGMHWVHNSLAVLAAVGAIGADIKQAAATLKEMLPPLGRGRIHKIAASFGDFTVIDESYNANPTSMTAALNVLGKYKNKRKIAVIGHMVELGEISHDRHRSLLKPLMDNQIDLVFCCGSHMTVLYEVLPDTIKGAYAPTSLELIPFVIDALEAGDVVTVKGSLATRMKPIVEALIALDRSSLKIEKMAG